MKSTTDVAQGHRWNGPLIVSVLAIVAAVVVALSAVPGVVSAVFSPWPDENTGRVLEELLVAHAETAANGQNRFLGRSPFFVPRRPPTRPAPAPPPRPTDPIVDTEPAEAPIAGPPSTYQGPKPTSLLGASVFFRSKEIWITVGKESGGVTVVAIKDPWTVTLGHSGGEYDVGLWGDRQSGFFSTPFDGTVRSSGFVSQSTPSAKGSLDPPKRPTPPEQDRSRAASNPSSPLSASDINRMSVREAADAMKGVMATLRNPATDVETQERLNGELDLLRARLRGGP